VAFRERGIQVKRTHSSVTSRSVFVARTASIDLANDASPTAENGAGSENGTVVEPCGDDGGGLGGKKASLV
jgi:hypothetical protein